MTELLRSWLLGITCAAMILALANGIMPEGGVKKMARLTGGLILMLAILKPVLTLRTGSLPEYFQNYQETMQEYELELEEGNSVLLADIIEEKTEAYILKKADELGVACKVKVRTETGEDGIPYPYRAEIDGDWNEALSGSIEQELNIPASRQTWSGKKDG